MIPDKKLRHTGTIRYDPASVDVMTSCVTSLKAGLSTVDRGITSEASRQTPVVSQSLHGPCRRRSWSWRQAKSGMNGRRWIHLVNTRTLTVSPGLLLLRPHCAHKRTLGGHFFILLLTFEMTASTFQHKMLSCSTYSCLQWPRLQHENELPSLRRRTTGST